MAGQPQDTVMERRRRINASPAFKASNSIAAVAIAAITSAFSAQAQDQDGSPSAGGLGVYTRVGAEAVLGQDDVDATARIFGVIGAARGPWGLELEGGHTFASDWDVTASAAQNLSGVSFGDGVDISGEIDSFDFFAGPVVTRKKDVRGWPLELELFAHGGALFADFQADITSETSLGSDGVATMRLSNSETLAAARGGVRLSYPLTDRISLDGHYAYTWVQDAEFGGLDQDLSRHAVGLGLRWRFGGGAQREASDGDKFGRFNRRSVRGGAVRATRDFSLNPLAPHSYPLPDDYTCGTVIDAPELVADGYTVNTTCDTHDGRPGDGLCSDENGLCSLRAAVEETNAQPQPGIQAIAVPAGIYALDLGQLDILDTVVIDGSGAEETIITAQRKSRVFWTRNTKALVCDAADDSVHILSATGQYETRLIEPGAGGLRELVDLDVYDDLQPDGSRRYSRGDGLKLVATGRASGLHVYDLQSGLHLGTPVTAGELAPGGAQAVLVDTVIRPWVLTGPGQAYGIAYTASLFPENTIHTALIDGGNVAASLEGDEASVRPFKLVVGEDFLFASDPSRNEIQKFSIPPTSIISGGPGVRPELVGRLVADGLNMRELRGFLFNVDSDVQRGYELGEEFLVVSQTDDPKINRFRTSDGRFIGEFASRDSAPLVEPTFIVRGPNDSIYVGDTGYPWAIRRFDRQSGQYMGDFVVGGEGARIQQPSCLIFINSPNTSGRAESDANLASSDPMIYLRNLTIADGWVGTTQNGAGILVGKNTQVRLMSAVVRDNEAAGFGGGIRNDGDLSVVETLVTRNAIRDALRETPQVGGVTNTGGGIFNLGKLNIRSSTISRNTAVRGGGIANFGELSLKVSTVSENVAITKGGGLYIRRKGVPHVSIVDITNSTITANETNTRARSGNEDTGGGGVYVQCTEGATTAGSCGVRVIMGHSILAENTDGGFVGLTEPVSPDCYNSVRFAIQAAGPNLLGAVSDNCLIGGDSPSVSPIIGRTVAPLDPRLGPLLSSVGPTPTHTPASNSPAVDSGDLTAVSPFSPDVFRCLGEDQRGVERPRDGDGDDEARCDLGSVER